MLEMALRYEFIAEIAEIEDSGDISVAQLAKYFQKREGSKHSVEYCMAEARKAIAHYNAPYWAIPVLFTNASDEAPRKTHKAIPQITIEQHGKANIVGNNVNYRG